MKVTYYAIVYHAIYLSRIYYCMALLHGSPNIRSIIPLLLFPTQFNFHIILYYRQSEIPADAWQKYAIFDDEKPYTRNLISTDGETYTLLLLCWNPQKESPIHDHPCDGCWLQVVQGGIREDRYDK